MRARHRDNLFQDETTILLPSIQNAVDHFRKNMKRQKSNLLRLPSLIKGNDDINYGGRIKYQHRSTEEMVRNSENWDKLKFIMHEENVANSIDLVFEANKPTGSVLDMLDCSPPLVSKSETDQINQYKDDSFEQQTPHVNDNEALENAIEAPGFQLTLADLLNTSTELRDDPQSSRKTQDEQNKVDTIKPTIQCSTTGDNASKNDKEQKCLKISVPTDDKSSKKKVRFNLESTSPRIINVKGNKQTKAKTKANSPVKPYGLSHVQETHYTSQRTKTGLAMKQMFKGQRKAQKT